MYGIRSGRNNMNAYLARSIMRNSSNKKNNNATKPNTKNEDDKIAQVVLFVLCFIVLTIIEFI